MPHPTLRERSFKPALILAVAALLPMGPAMAQGVDGLVAPRGSLVFQIFPSFHTFETGFEADGRKVPLGARYTLDNLGSDVLPGLTGPEAALRSLLEADDIRFRVGITRSRVRGHEARFPISASWGITDRITVGAILPIVRRRVEAGMAFAPEGANVGANPFFGDEVALETLLASMATALDEGQDRVAQLCDEEGSDSEPCRSGASLLEHGLVLAQALPGILEGTPVAPLQHSGTGEPLVGLFDDVRAGLEELGVVGFPLALPLPTDPLTAEEFRSGFLVPAFGANRPPTDSWPGIPELGDVELQVSGLLADVTFGGEAEDGRFHPMRIRSAGGLILRLGTQQPDTLRDHFEGVLPAGHSGLRVRFVNDLEVGSLLGLGLHFELLETGAGEVRRRISPSGNPFDPESERLPVRWDPGRVLAFEVTPRLHLTPELSISTRYAYAARASDRYQTPGNGGGDLALQNLLPPGDVRAHTLGAGITYSTAEQDPDDGAGRPFLARIRIERTVSGAGGRVPGGTRIEGGARIYLRR